MTVLVLVEHAGGEPRRCRSRRSPSHGRSRPAELHALLVGPGARCRSRSRSHGVATAHVAEHDALAAFAPDAWAQIVAELADRLDATTVVAAGSEVGNDVLARVAARLDLPFAANVVAASADGALERDAHALGRQPPRGGDGFTPAAGC